jgi:uncharacterized membrane protein
VEAARPALTDRGAGSIRHLAGSEKVAVPRRWAGLLAHLPVSVLVAAYGLRFSLLSVSVHRGFGTPAFDMAIPDQAIWLLSRFHAPFSTVMGRNFFGDHTSFVLVLLVPLFWVYPHTAALLVVQSFLLAAGAIPVYLYARRRLGSTTLATLLAASYLLNPALQNGNLEQFHVECFTVLLLALALYAALENKAWLLVISVGLLLLCKEDTALLVVPLGVWVAWRQNRKWGIRLLIAAVAWTLLASEVVIKSLVGVTNVHHDRIPFGGAGGLVRTIVRRPGTFTDYLRADQRPFYVWQMLSSAGLVLFRAPEVAAIGILTLSTNVLAAFGYEHEIVYHYSLPLVPVLAMGTVFAVGALRTAKSRRVATGFVAVCSLWACLLWGLAPFSMHKYPHLSPSNPEVLNINRVLKSLPGDAVVTAYYPYVSHIDHRTRIYMWPNPFQAQYWDRFQEEGERLPFADEVRWLVLPTDLTGSDATLFASIAPTFHLVQQDGNVALYEHN